MWFNKSAKDFFSESQKNNIVKAIQVAEKNTSGEIRVHIAGKCKLESIRTCAEITFSQLEMDKTQLKNGVLIYLSLRDRAFSIIGDQGINDLVEENFWGDVKNLMQKHFREEHFDKGLIEAITLVGEKLKAFFPYQSDDINELPDDISFEK